ncbi:hypothetical protein [Poriferisphaera sp. WC338]|uniref:hypothetical protein n=1 Tax=Poriferisphaera sp. WC338 TaxID=3425129 RepID=UPI003D816F98
MTEQPTPENPLQAYFDWQVTTLMLAFDVHDPIPYNDEHAATARRQKLEQLVSSITLEVVPDKYKSDPNIDWPPELMRTITQATLKKANDIIASKQPLPQ